MRLTDDANIIVSFFVDGEKCAIRHWSHVPRAGDKVMLGTGSEEKMACTVRRVVWGVESDWYGYQTVTIELKRAIKEGNR